MRLATENSSNGWFPL